MYLSFSVVGGMVVAGESPDITPSSLFQPSGGVWSLDGPALGFLCSIAVTWVNQAANRVSYDPRPLNGSVTEVNFSHWGTAVVQPDGRYAIQIPA